MSVFHFRHKPKSTRFSTDASQSNLFYGTILSVIMSKTFSIISLICFLPFISPFKKRRNSSCGLILYKDMLVFSFLVVLFSDNGHCTVMLPCDIIAIACT